MIAGAPRDVVDASQRLACSTCVLVNVGVDRADLSQAQMTYFYDEDICFTRLSFPHMLSATNVPPGCGSIQAEVYFSSKYRPLTQAPEDLIEPVISDLRRSGTLREDDKILTSHARVVRYANVIFDLDRAAALEDRPRLPRRHRHRLLRPLRRLGLHVDRRELHQRGACGATGFVARLRSGVANL